MEVLPQSSGRRALVIEADMGTRETCRAALESLGFSVHAVDSGVSAVASARQATPDIVLFDLQLRDVRGSELLDWLRSNPALSNVPMIAISVLSGTDTAAVESRVYGVLRKPVSQTQAEVVVRGALRRAAVKDHRH